MVGSHDDGYAPHKARNLELEAKAIRIQSLNDLFRRGEISGMLVVTSGVRALGPDRMAEVLARVRAFSDFDDDNDPYLEHDFGSIEVGDVRIFWKIDCYDKQLEFGSPDRTSPELTTRVMTIMLVSEY